MRKFIFRFLPVLLVIILLIGIAVPLVKICNTSSVCSGRIQLCYDGAYKGMTPIGTRMDIYRIDRDDFLDKVLTVLGEKAEGVTVDDLHHCISIAPYFVPDFDPDSADSTYRATEYVVTIDAKGPTFRDLTSKEILEAIFTAFQDTFTNEYSNNNLSRFEVDWDTVQNMEYFEVLELMRDKVSMLDTYVREMNRESPLNQDWKNSSSFATLNVMTDSFTKSVLDNFEVFLTGSRVFRNAERFQFKERYEALETYTAYLEWLSKYKINEGIVKNYDSTMITYVFEPLHNDINGLYMARTDTGIDSFTDDMNDSFSHYSELGESLDRISEYLKLSFGSEDDIKQLQKEKKFRNFNYIKFNVEALADNGTLLSTELPVTHSQPGDQQTADTMLKNMEEQYTELMEQVRATVEEYSVNKGANAISCEVFESTFDVMQFIPELFICGMSVVIFIAGFVWRRSLKSKESIS